MAIGGECPIVLCHSRSHGVDQGQWLGRCRIGRRCGRVSRAGMLMMVRRSVDPRARVCRSPASTPAACSRLCVMAVQSTQAELTPNRPNGIGASGDAVVAGGYPHTAIDALMTLVAQKLHELDLDGQPVPPAFAMSGRRR
jgi:hypothetical protein